MGAGALGCHPAPYRNLPHKAPLHDCIQSCLNANFLMPKSFGTSLSLTSDKVAPQVDDDRGPQHSKEKRATPPHQNLINQMPGLII